MMSVYRVERGTDGWVLTDGSNRISGFDSPEAAAESANALNGSTPPDEGEGQFVNHQGGLELDPSQHQVAPAISRGGRHSETRMVADADQGEKVSYLVPPDGPLAPQMVSESRGSKPDGAPGDVLVAPSSAIQASVWEAVEGEGAERRTDEVQARMEAADRAAVTTDIPSGGTQDNLGGGPGGR